MAITVWTARSRIARRPINASAATAISRIATTTRTINLADVASGRGLRFRFGGRLAFFPQSQRVKVMKSFSRTIQATLSAIVLVGAAPATNPYPAMLVPHVNDGTQLRYRSSFRLSGPMTHVLNVQFTDTVHTAPNSDGLAWTRHYTEGPNSGVDKKGYKVDADGATLDDKGRSDRSRNVCLQPAVIRHCPSPTRVRSALDKFRSACEPARPAWRYLDRIGRAVRCQDGTRPPHLSPTSMRASHIPATTGCRATPRTRWLEKKARPCSSMES